MRKGQSSTQQELTHSLMITISSPSCVCVLSHSSCVQLCDPMDGNPPGSSVHGILQARILEWVDMPSSRGSSRTHVSWVGRGFFTTSATTVFCSFQSSCLAQKEDPGGELDPGPPLPPGGSQGLRPKPLAGALSRRNPPKPRPGVGPGKSRQEPA